MAPPRLFTRVPRTVQEWTAAAVAANVITKSLKSCRTLVSASKITQEQFLLCRTISPDIEGDEIMKPAIFGLSQYTAQVQLLLQTPDFQAYIANVGTDALQGLVTFQATLIQQYEVVKGDKDLKSKLHCTDETAVNSSLLNFLQALRAMVPETNKQWRSSRIELRANFGNVAGESNPRQYYAVTDGQLQEAETGEINAIIECKRKRRRYHSPNVEMQEVAQFVAWVKEYPDARSGPTEHQRVMVSQNGIEIYVVTFDYDDKYVAYLNGGSIANAGFALARKYGPWYINNRADIANIAEILLGLILIL